MTTRLLLLLLLTPVLNFAHAATFYVDANAGNDAWSGLRSAPVSTPTADGPWQSLEKVSGFLLQPGDSVLLKCGSVWHETFTLKRSGTASSPIHIGSYPDSCTNKPLINGSIGVPAQNWVRDTGNIYKLSSTVNLIASGSFESGFGNWTQWSPSNNATLNLNSTCTATSGKCLVFTAGSGNSILIINNFTLHGKRPYTAGFAAKIPTGIRVRAILRRGAAPWNSVGLDTYITGTGSWQFFSLPFIATSTLTNARLDFEVPAGRTINLDEASVITTPSHVKGVFVSGRAVNPAHHPNRGYNPQQPDSTFYVIPENTDRVSSGNGTGSSYLTAGTELSASLLAAIKPGTGIRIRTLAWNISDRKIASISGSRLYLDKPSSYPIEKGWGYFLYGQRWMLDQPGEWHHDNTTQTTYAWMSDSAAPGSRISLGQLDTGIDASNLLHLRIDNLAIQNTVTGVRMFKSNNIVLSNMSISDTLGLGIDADHSSDSGVETSIFARTEGDAISAGPNSVRFNASNNLISQSGVQLTGSNITSLPGPAKPTIDAGRGAVIRGNRIYAANYIGIRVRADSLVSGNHIEDACLVLDDCGAIYTDGQNNNSIIENNTVLRAPGGLLGKPFSVPSQSQGIYLDSLSSGVTVKGNTVVDADSGIQLHNAANNLIEDNTLYGNRRHQIWMQEGTQRTNPEGDIYGNRVLGNRLFSTLANAAIGHVTELAKDNTDQFASYDRNLYFILLSPTIASESWAGGGASYTLPAWKTAVGANGQPRLLDYSGREINSQSAGYAVFRITGANVLPNGQLTAGKTGWTAWNKTAPYGQMVLETCTPASQCLRYTAGASTSLLVSPNFTTHKDQWYKVSFDLKAGTNGQAISTVVRRGGGGTNSYELLMGGPVNITGSTAWKRFSFSFKALNTVKAKDPITLDLGARVDFTLSPGQNLSVTNLEVVPLSSAEISLRSHILLNPADSGLSLDCPDGPDAESCHDYVRFTDGARVNWPYPLPPHGSEIIYSRDSSLVDSDSDGIPDHQDSCSATPIAQAVNATGCALGENSLGIP